MSTLENWKIVVLGSGGVGKSSLTRRFQDDIFSDEYDPTIEDAYRRNYVVDNKVCYMDILDTPGQEEFQSMIKLWIREAQGFLLVYSITQRSTFEEIPVIFQQILTVKEEISEIAVVLAGNKIDLEERRQVTSSDGKSLVESWKNKGLKNGAFFETSAKANINVTEAFHELVRLVRKIKDNSSQVTQATTEFKCCVLL